MPATVRKEVWVQPLVYNMVRMLMAQSTPAAVRLEEMTVTRTLHAVNVFLPNP
jgi:hypothetical protein